MKVEFIKIIGRPKKGEWREGGWWRSACSGLEAGSEIKELRMSEQMGKQRPREVNHSPRVTQQGAE